MAYIDDIKIQIGKDRFERLEGEADKELARALAMPFKNQYGDNQYYTKRFLIGELSGECHAFDTGGLRILPTDLVGAMFRAKLMFANEDKDSFMHRSGEGSAAIGMWYHKPATMAEALELYFQWIKDSIMERTLLTQLSSYVGLDGRGSETDAQAIQQFLEKLFQKLNLPFVAYTNQRDLMEKYKQMEPGLRAYTEKRCQQFFYAPSIGYTVTGSESYCYFYASAWLRTFLQLLRIAGFVNAPQLDSHPDVSYLPPKGSVFRGSYVEAAYSWLEGRRESWAKSPDGNLFLSFGYRMLSNMWLDSRTFPRIESFILAHRQILESMKHPWKKNTLRDAIPTLDLLNTVTQLPDEGGKLLLLYCCLEHLFVPRNTTYGNRGFIQRGINSLKPDLANWFRELYELRCAYAHKGFLESPEQNRGLLMQSVKNVLTLITAKLANG